LGCGCQPALVPYPWKSVIKNKKFRVTGRDS